MQSTWVGVWQICSFGVRVGFLGGPSKLAMNSQLRILRILNVRICWVGYLCRFVSISPGRSKGAMGEEWQTVCCHLLRAQPLHGPYFSTFANNPRKIPQYVMKESVERDVVESMIFHSRLFGCYCGVVSYCLLSPLLYSVITFQLEFEKATKLRVQVAFQKYYHSDSDIKSLFCFTSNEILVFDNLKQCIKELRLFLLQCRQTWKSTWEKIVSVLTLLRALPIYRYLSEDSPLNP